VNTHQIVLIAGAVALLWYCGKKKNASASSVAANSANAQATYTTTQAAQAEQWWNYAGSWQA